MSRECLKESASCISDPLSIYIWNFLMNQPEINRIHILIWDATILLLLKCCDMNQRPTFLSDIHKLANQNMMEKKWRIEMATKAQRQICICNNNDRNKTKNILYIVDSTNNKCFGSQCNFETFQKWIHSLFHHAKNCIAFVYLVAVVVDFIVGGFLALLSKKKWFSMDIWVELLNIYRKNGPFGVGV